MSMNGEILNNSKLPLVSVIMNCYNGEKYLQQAIDSVYGQTYQNWEIIFWDNASTDSSSEIAKLYGDGKLKYYKEEVNTTLGVARNNAIRKSSGELIAFLDVDDYWEKGKLELQVPLFRSKRVGVVCGNYWIETELENRKKSRALAKSKLYRGSVVNQLLSNYFVGNLTLMVRKEALRELTGPLNVEYPIIADFDLVARIALSWDVDYVPEAVATYRRHENNLTITDEVDHARQMVKWIESTNSDIYKQYPGYIVRQCRTYYKALVAYRFSGNYYNAFRYLIKITCYREWFRGLLVMLIPKFILAYFRK